MTDSVNPEESIYLTRGEKTVLVDALRWYLDEHEMPERNSDDMETAKEILDDTQYLDLSLVDGNLIRETLLVEFSLALKPHIREGDNPEATGGFYKTQFEGISEKITAHQKQNNPFY